MLTEVYYVKNGNTVDSRYTGDGWYFELETFECDVAGPFPSAQLALDTSREYYDSLDEVLYDDE